MDKFFPVLCAALMASAGCREERVPSPSPLFLLDQVPASQQGFERSTLPFLGEEAALSATVSLGNETRRALAPTNPSRLTLTAKIPDNPVLDFATAVATLGKPTGGFPLEFRVSLNTGQGEEIVFQRLLTRARRNRWIDRRVDLSPWSGERAQITFEVSSATRDPSQDLFPLWGNPVISDTQGSRERPPIFLISVDCLRPDHVGSYGYDRNTTPHIDAFARHASIFENVTAVSAWTLPTHMSMMTGLMPSFHGTSRSEKLAPSIPYLPELLSNAGYLSAGVVSGAYLHQNFGFERGFHTYRSLVRPRATDVVDAALEILDRSLGTDRFVFIHIIDPHWKYLPPEGFIDRFGPKPQDVESLLDRVIKRQPPSGPEEIEALVSLYDGEVAYVDEQIGRFLNELQRRSLFDPSLIIITADHGEAFFEHGYWQHSDTLYEEMIRVPLAVKWPDQTALERVSVHASQLDLFPTILEAAGIPSPFAQGRSLSNYRKVDDAGKAVTVISETIWSSPERNHMKVAIRRGGWKYIATFSTESNERLTIEEMILEELFHLETDPGEKENLLPSKEAESLRRELTSFLEQAKVFRSTHRVGSPVMMDGDIEERLRKLGYIQ